MHGHHDVEIALAEHYLFGIEQLTAVLIPGMEIFMGLVAAGAAAERFLIAAYNQMVVLRLLELLGLVGVVEARGAELARILRMAGYRLSAAADAAAGAGHDFDEVIFCLA
ncbi:hypothetical protein SDC9_188596 [bioreactor metagenome]|uniref:Uncharacterized protein n=1 Tax=bioreactor metagenome TaxID=1076179 RepID=A0A645HR63_9ZZZZ